MSNKGKGIRGTSWSRSETLSLLKIWGDAELKHGVSSLKRNYMHFADISAELAKIGVFRGPLECRTKTKILRRDYKRALAHNDSSGVSPSPFPYMKQMNSIFRSDPSMIQLQAADNNDETSRGKYCITIILDIAKNLYNVQPFEIIFLTIRRHIS